MERHSGSFNYFLNDDGPVLEKPKIGRCPTSRVEEFMKRLDEKSRNG